MKAAASELVSFKTHGRESHVKGETTPLSTHKQLRRPQLPEKGITMGRALSKWEVDDILMATAAAPQIYSGLRPPRPLFYLITGQNTRMESAQRRIWPAVSRRGPTKCVFQSCRRFLTTPPRN